jgi:hypothetical protein
VPDAVPDVEGSAETPTPSTVTSIASPGRTRSGETRTDGPWGGRGSAEEAGRPRRATAATARILK